VLDFAPALRISAVRHSRQRAQRRPSEFAATKHMVPGLQVHECNTLSILTKRSILVDRNPLGNALWSLNGQLGTIDGLDFARDEALAHAFSEVAAGRVALASISYDRCLPGIFVGLFPADKNHVVYLEIGQRRSFTTPVVLRLVVECHSRCLPIASLDGDRVRIDGSNSSGNSRSLAIS
jgi:hypothetical protein